MKLILVILSVAIASSTGSKLPFAQENDLANIQGRIIDGWKAKKGEVPYIVGLAFTDFTSIFTCSGSIIGNSWILTAAHCTEDMISVKILYGSTRWNHQLDEVTEVGSANFVEHPLYDGDQNDIALIRTPYVQFSKLINMIKLADRDNDYEYSQSTACGWGRINGLFPITPKDLQCVSLNVINNDECQQSWIDYYPDPLDISPSQLCVSTLDKKSTCKGDSGGPLVTPDGAKLIGVTSFGDPVCGQIYPAVFTRVSVYLDWIRVNTGIE